MSLEVEMIMEQLKEQHLQEMEDLRNQLESKVSLVDTFLCFTVLDLCVHYNNKARRSRETI